MVCKLAQFLQCCKTKSITSFGIASWNGATGYASRHLFGALFLQVLERSPFFVFHDSPLFEVGNLEVGLA